MEVTAVAEPVIHLRDVIKVYREVDVETIALRGLDLDVQDGEFVAVMGRSGSGKTTLLNLLAGVDRPTAGRVTVCGVALDRAEESEREQLRGRSVGMVFQMQNLIPYLTLTENVLLAGSLASRRVSADDARELLDRVGLAERARHRPEQLSGGEQQRAALSCVLAGAPQVLLADEITGELDSNTAAEVLGTVRGVHRDRGVTVVMVTHDDEVAAFADRVVRLADGRVVSDHRSAMSRSNGDGRVAGVPGLRALAGRERAARGQA